MRICTALCWCRTVAASGCNRNRSAHGPWRTTAAAALSGDGALRRCRAAVRDAGRIGAARPGPGGVAGPQLYPAARQLPLVARAIRGGEILAARADAPGAAAEPGRGGG